MHDRKNIGYLYFNSLTERTCYLIRNGHIERAAKNVAKENWQNHENFYSFFNRLSATLKKNHRLRLVNFLHESRDQRKDGLPIGKCAIELARRYIHKENANITCIYVTLMSAQFHAGMNETLEALYVDYDAYIDRNIKQLIPLLGQSTKVELLTALIPIYIKRNNATMLSFLANLLPKVFQDSLKTLDISKQHYAHKVLSLKDDNLRKLFTDAMRGFS